MDQVDREVQPRKRTLDHAENTGNAGKICRYFGIGLASVCRWRKEYLEWGAEGLAPEKPR